MAMKEMYNGVEIIYSEENSRFEFELRGKERFASSMKTAKEAIDKPVAGKKFDPVRAILRGYGGVYRGTITSIAEVSHSQQVWFVRDENKARFKESLSDMCEESERNLKLLAESVALDKEADTLGEKAAGKRNSMKPIKITIPE